MRGALFLDTFPFKEDEHLFMQHADDDGGKGNFRRIGNLREGADILGSLCQTGKQVLFSSSK